MAAPMVIYGVIVIARAGVSLAALNRRQAKLRQQQSLFSYQGGAVFHEYC